MSINNKKFLSKSKNWFRLPENIQSIFETIGSIEDIDTADASDAATAITLANANKAKLNQILAAFREVSFVK